MLEHNKIADTYTDALRGKSGKKHRRTREHIVQIRPRFLAVDSGGDQHRLVKTINKRKRISQR